MTKKPLFNQQGMTLVEIMIAASLLAGLAVAGMTLFKTQTVGQKTVEANYEITNLFQQIRILLSDQQNCTQSFAGLNPNTFVSPATFTLQKRRPNLPVAYDPVFRLNQNLVGNVKITSYRLERNPVANLATNETWLKINFSKGKSTLMENTTRMMKVIVAPAPAATNTSITGCYAYNNSTDTYWVQATPPDIYYSLGEVGIGNSDPLAPLHVSGSAPGGETLRLNGAVGPEGGQISLMDSAGNGAWEIDNMGAGPTATLRIFRDKGVNNTNAMGITSSGFVGINNYTPAHPLDVTGFARASGEIISTMTTGAGQFRAVGGAYGAIFRQDGANLYLPLLTASGDPYGTWNALRPIRVENATGDVYLQNGASVFAHNGNVGIGTSAPTNRLAISGNTSLLGSFGFNRNPDTGALPAGGNPASGRYQFTASLGYLGMESYSTAGAHTGGLYILAANGNVGIANTNPTYKLDVTGDVRVTNMWAVDGFWYSDARLKKDVKDYKKGLEEILRLEPKRYTWKKDDRKDIGFIAQDVKKVLPELVHESTDKEKTLTIKLLNFFPLIVNAIQDLYEMITGTQAEQEKLRRDVAQLKKENQELKARLDRQDEVLRSLEKKAAAGK